MQFTPSLSVHAAIRAQQRGIPPLIHAWLSDYGEEIHDGRGAVIRYFSRRSVRKLEKDVGAVPVRRMSDFLRTYMVERQANGNVITVAKRHRGHRFHRR